MVSFFLSFLKKGSILETYYKIWDNLAIKNRGPPLSVVYTTGTFTVFFTQGVTFGILKLLRGWL